jgi:hypothetical protein
MLHILTTVTHQAFRVNTYVDLKLHSSQESKIQRLGQDCDNIPHSDKGDIECLEEMEGGKEYFDATME